MSAEIAVTTHLNGLACVRHAMSGIRLKKSKSRRRSKKKHKVEIGEDDETEKAVLLSDVESKEHDQAVNGNSRA